MINDEYRRGAPPHALGEPFPAQPAIYGERRTTCAEFRSTCGESRTIYAEFRSTCGERRTIYAEFRSIYAEFRSILRIQI